MEQNFAPQTSGYQPYKPAKLYGNPTRVEQTFTFLSTNHATFCARILKTSLIIKFIMFWCTSQPLICRLAHQNTNVEVPRMSLPTVSRTSAVIGLRTLTLLRQNPEQFS